MIKKEPLKRHSLTFFIDQFIFSDKIACCNDIHKIRSNWNAVERYYGFNLNFLSDDKKNGSCTTFYCGDTLVFMELNEIEDRGTMLFLNLSKEMIVFVLPLLKEHISPEAHKILCSNYQKTMEDESHVNVRLSNNPPMMIM